jgi:hypothetical protein
MFYKGNRILSLIAYFVTLSRSPDSEQSEQEGASEGASLFAEFTLSEAEVLRMTRGKPRTGLDSTLSPLPRWERAKVRVK